MTSGFVGTPGKLAKYLDEKLPEPQTLQEWYNGFCKGGKPIRKFSYLVSAVIPDPHSGVIATQASQYRSAWKIASDFVAPSLFLAGSRRPETRASHPGERPQAKVIAINSQEEAKIIDDYSLDVYQQNHQFPEENESRSMMFLKTSQREKIYLVPRFALFLTNQQGVGALSGNKIETIQVPKSKTSNFPPLYLAQQEFSARLNSKKGTEIIELSPLSISYMEDVYLMSDKFVMLIPREEQEKFGLRYYDPTDLKNAVEKRHKIFEEVARKFTTVKSEQSENPSVINYEISFDYGLFCAYGRPLQDFISK